MRLLRPPRLLPALVLAALGLLARPLAAQETPAGFEQGIYDLVVTGLNPVSVPVLLGAHGAVLVPLRPLLELTGAPFRVVPDSGLAVVSRPRGAGEAVLDLRAGTLTAARKAAITKDEAVVWQGDVYLATARAAELLEAQVEVDQAELVVRFTRVVPFPAQERIEAAAQRQLASLLPGAGPTVDPRTVPFIPRSGAGVLEWAVSGAAPSPANPTAVMATLGLGVWGGMLSVGASVSNPGGGIPPSADPQALYRRVFPLGHAIRQVQVGDLATENLRVRSIRGFSVTNAPFIRDPLFGEVPFDPRLPTGWDYEVYQNGRLLGFSQGTQRGAISIPLGYGSTPVRIRMYGPAGEKVETEVVYLVPVLQLPAGRTQYALGGGQCTRDQECRQMGYVDLRRGLTRAATVFAGTDVLRDSAGVRAKPYGGLSLIPAPSWSLSVQGMAGSFFQAAVQNLGAGRVSGSLSGGITFPELKDQAVVGTGGFPTLPAAGTRWNVDGNATFRTGQGGGWLHTLSTTGRVEGSRESGLDRARGSLITTLRSVILEGAFEHTASPLVGTADVGSLRATLPLTALWRGLPRGAIASGELGASAGGIQRGEFGLYAQTGPFVVNLVSRWDAASGKPSLILSSTLRFSAGRVQTRVGSNGGRMAGGMTVSGAAAFAPGGGTVAPLPYGGLGQSGIRGTVFHDVNGNGRLDPGDAPVPGARVFIGGALVKTDSAGRYATWSVLPYEVAGVRVDTAGLADPSWVPTGPAVFVRPPPHLYTRVDIPLVQTHEVSGQLVPGRNVPTAGGVTVEIVPDSASAEPLRAITFSDGAFYVGRVLPGRYTVRVAASSLQALRARAAPASIPLVVPSTADQPLVELPPIRLERS